MSSVEAQHARDTRGPVLKNWITSACIWWMGCGVLDYTYGLLRNWSIREWFYMADLDPIDPVTFLSGSTHNALIFHRRKKEKKKTFSRQCRAAALEEYLKVPLLFKIQLRLSHRWFLTWNQELDESSFLLLLLAPLFSQCVGGNSFRKKPQRAMMVLTGEWRPEARATSQVGAPLSIAATFVLFLIANICRGISNKASAQVFLTVGCIHRAK